MRTESRKGTSISRSELTPYNVGVMRLQEAEIGINYFDEDEIKRIGYCSIQRQHITLIKVRGVWMIAKRGEDVREYTHIVIKGKRVQRFQMRLRPTEKSKHTFRKGEKCKVKAPYKSGLFNSTVANVITRHKAPKVKFDQQLKYHIMLESF